MHRHVALNSSAVSRDSQSTISSYTSEDSTTSILIWIYRIIISIILILFIVPIALLLTPWWICMQPFERLCPNMMKGYYRFVTWPFTLSKNIRFYHSDSRFIDHLTY